MLEEGYLKLIKLKDKRLAKNARVEYINGRKYEWGPGNVAGQCNSSLSSTFAPTPNFYDVLEDSDDAVYTPSVQRSNGPTINREQQKALIITSPRQFPATSKRLNDPNHKWALALAEPMNSSVHQMNPTINKRRTIKIAGDRHPVRKGPHESVPRMSCQK